MDTKILKPSKHCFMLAKNLIINNQLVAFPTETVYGLGANALSDQAVEKIFIAKGRPQDNPLILHVGRKSDIEKYVKNITPAHKKLIAKFMPGPISIVFDKADNVSSLACAGGSTVAVRIPKNKIARRFINECNLPICAPSANTSKRPSPTCANHVYNDLNQKIELIIDGGNTSVGIESTVVKVENNTIFILREGKINKKMLERATHLSVVSVLNTNKIPQSPGTKYAHYVPLCEMIVVKNNIVSNSIKLYENILKTGKKPIIFCSQKNAKFYKNKNFLVLGKNSVEASHNLFGYLRRVEKNYDAIIAEYFDNGGMVEGLFNRMIKAAGGKIV